MDEEEQPAVTGQSQGTGNAEVTDTLQSILLTRMFLFLRNLSESEEFEDVEVIFED